MPHPELAIDRERQEMILWFRSEEWSWPDKSKVSNQCCPNCPLNAQQFLQRNQTSAEGLICETLSTQRPDAAIVRAKLLPDGQLDSVDLDPNDEATVRNSAACLQKK